jgi:hypothetical protein
MFCTKETEIPTVATKQMSICLFDRSLYKRLIRLIPLLSGQCIQNNIRSQSIPHNLIYVSSPH